MKKNYITPSIVIVRFNHQDRLMGNGSVNAGLLDITYGGVDTEGILEPGSRRTIDWWDEEEDEEDDY